MGQTFGTFLRPSGASADLKELEYVSALQQSELPNLRTDGTVSSSDVALFLMSRYGIECSGEEALDVVRGLGGGGGGGGGRSAAAKEEDAASGAVEDKPDGGLGRTGGGGMERPLSPSPPSSTAASGAAADAAASFSSSSRAASEAARLRMYRRSTAALASPSAVEFERHSAARLRMRRRSAAATASVVEFERARRRRRQLSRRRLDLVVGGGGGGGNGTSASMPVSSSVAAGAATAPRRRRRSASTVLSAVRERSSLQEEDSESSLTPAEESVRKSTLPRRGLSSSARLALSGAARAASVLIPEAYVERIPPHHDEGNEDASTDADTGEEAYLDLAQLASVILMPTLARAGAEWEEEERRRRRSACETEGDDVEKGQSGTPQIGTICGTESLGHSTANNASATATAADPEAELEQSLRVTPPALIRDVLRMLLEPLRNYEAEIAGLNSFHEADDNAAAATADARELDVCPKDEDGNYIINEDLVRTLLELHSEFELALDDELLSEMVTMASCGFGGGGKRTEGRPAEGRPKCCVLDEEAFVRALASDLRAWDVSCESRQSAFFQDVHGLHGADDGKTCDTATKQRAEGSKQQENCISQSGKAGQSAAAANAVRKSSLSTDTSEVSDTKKANPPVLRPTFAFIDMARDTQRSALYVAFLFVFYVGTVLTYVFLFQTLTVGHGICEQGFACSIGHKVYRWVTLAAMLMAAGVLITIPLSLGNNPIERSWKSGMFSIALAAFYTISPYFFVERARTDPRHSNNPFFDDTSKMMNSYYYRKGMIMTFVLGWIVIIMLLAELIVTVIPDDATEKCGGLVKRLFTPSTVKGAAKSKIAAARKANGMLANAYKLHPAHLRSDSEELSSVSRRKSRGTTGRWVETDALLNFAIRGETHAPCGGFFWTWTRILDEELFKTEGVWIHTRLYTAQLTQLMVLLFLGFFLIGGTKEIARMAGEARGDLDDDPFVMLYPEWVVEIVPTEEQVYYALYPASAVALAVAFLIMLIYIPSTASTVLKFRTGVLPSLHDRNFVRYRLNADTVFLNLGNVAYAMLGSAFLFFAVVGLFLFLLIWPFSRPLMSLIGAWMVGLAITIGIKAVSTKMCRRNYHQAFFRKRPAAANVSTLLLECWHVGLGGGVLIGRLVQFLFAAIFFIGRVDVPFLSEEVCVGGWIFDTAPTSYRKDVLVHEAHRHPWVERLGAMYLMRLKHKGEFSSRAGAAWRLLFVVSLMPWLKKYRVFDDDDDEVGADADGEEEEDGAMEECDAEFEEDAPQTTTSTTSDDRARETFLRGPHRHRRKLARTVARSVAREVGELARETYVATNEMT